MACVSAKTQAELGLVACAHRVKSYESKIATLTIIHGAVQKENEKLRNELKQARQPATLAEEELVELQEEFSRRLGSADQTIARLQASTNTYTASNPVYRTKYALCPLSFSLRPVV